MAKRKPENELKFKIDAFTPDTLPLNVFAEYVANLAALLGSPENFNFVRVGKGSASLIQKVKQHAITGTIDRIGSVKLRTAPEDALTAFVRINQLLVRDNAVGSLSMGRAKLIEFPGRKERHEPPIGPVSQPDYLDGQLIRVGGKDATVPVQIRDEDGVIHYCTANIAMAMELSPFLYRQTLRVHGTGNWYRHHTGEWVLEFFRIVSFEKLDDSSLSDAVEAIRLVDSHDWPVDIEDKLAELRAQE